MSTLDVVAQAGGRAANFLDVGGGAQAQEIVDALEVITSDARCARSSSTSSAASRAATRSPRASSTRSTARHRRADRRAPRRHVRRGGAQAAGRREPARRVRRAHDAGRRPARRRARRSDRLMAILVTSETRLVVQGITGREGSFHATRNRDYGTAVVAGVTPGKGGQDVNGIPVFDTVAQAVEKEGANTVDGVRAAAVRRRRDLRGRRRGLRDRDLHHRGHSGARHDGRLRLRPLARRDAARPQLPGRALARGGLRRHHPDEGLQEGPGRPRLALRHADLPDRQRAGPGRRRQLDDRRDRRRPDRGLVLHRHPAALRGRPADRARGHGGRDRRARRRSARPSSSPTT